MSKNQELTDQQKRFIREYIIDHHGTNAAKRAGYSPQTARFSASRLLADPKIKKAIQEAQEELGEQTGITPERILHEMAKIGFSNILDYITQDENGDTIIDLKAIDRDAAAALTELYVETTKGRSTVRKVKVKPYDKMAALVQMGKHIGMFKEQLEVRDLTLEDLVLQSMKTNEEEKSKDNE